MSSESALEAEELENVPLVRMEDVQPDRSAEYSRLTCDEVLETCIVDGDFECVDDEHSNIGSMVSIKSEEVICEEELIVPEILDEDLLEEHGEITLEFEEENDEEDVEQCQEVKEVAKQKPKAEHKPTTMLQIKAQKQNQTVRRTQLAKSTVSSNHPESWPTLEILPGGVINLAEKTDSSDQDDSFQETMTETTNEMLYVCAKCSQSFKFLFCLVKHVRWHEVEARKMKMMDLQKMSPIEKKMAELKRRSNEIDKNFKHRKGIPNGPNETKKSKSKGNYICLHSIKRKIVSNPRAKKPKKS